MLNGFGGELGYGTNDISFGDDTSSNELDLPFVINYFGEVHDTFFINSNGNITFNDGFTTFTPQPFPLDRIADGGGCEECGDDGEPAPQALLAEPEPDYLSMIAPFWADVDVRDGGQIFLGAPDQNSIAVTWKDVAGYGLDSEQTNSFQLVLINRDDTGAGNFDVEFRYDQIEWTTGSASGGVAAQVGYDAGDGENHFTLPGSRSEAVRDLVSTSNTGEDGVWRFAIRDGALPGQTPLNPIMPVIVDGGFDFDFNVIENEIVFIDPDVAVGYDYIVDQGPNIRSVILPAGFDDDIYALWLFGVNGWEEIGTINAGEEYFFASGGVNQFRITGIDVDNAVDPEDLLAFVTGLSFVDAGQVQMRQVPITEFVADPSSVPGPQTLILLVLACFALSVRSRKITR
ncbi:nidogen [Alginatibacterium sediminis]|uniref:Nidogen n=2 Tax=Alginatibacterium sediminis TaxID=2164068 RepID=A0A420EDX1_9ALTE|nr:nidogen [Alginatibacterium sediminis]